HATEPTAPAPTTTATTVPVTVTTVTAPPDGSLIPGLEGDAVRALQVRLIALHYDPGPPDGRYGGALASAVMGFQKVAGMARTGRATPGLPGDVAAATAPAAAPPARG